MVDPTNGSLSSSSELYEQFLSYLESIKALPTTAEEYAGKRGPALTTSASRNHSLLQYGELAVVHQRPGKEIYQDGM